MVDLKLIALQAGTFGRPFAIRFAPMTFAAAIVSAGVVGWLVLTPVLLLSVGAVSSTA